MSPRDATLDPDALASRMASIPAWAIVDGHLHREFVFADFAQAFAFMERVAPIAEGLDHHPDWSNSWNRVVVDITNHDAGGLTDRCLRLASGIDAVVEA